MRRSSASLGRTSGAARCTANSGSSGACALDTSTGTISTATPLRDSAACAAIAAIRLACSGVRTSSQNTVPLA